MLTVAVFSLMLLVLYFALAFGARTAAQLRSTGSTGFKGVSGRPLTAGWFGGVLFVAALALGFAAPLPDLAGVVEPFAVLGSPAWRAVGLVLPSLGLFGTLVAQGTMGVSWRVGVDETEKTRLVTAGPFAYVRNPIFTAMVPALAGLALAVPNPVSFAGVGALVAAVELQVRAVEEPHLLRAHARCRLRGVCLARRAVRAGGRAPEEGR